MNTHLNRWATLGGIAALWMSGCAATGEAGKAPWLNLPSPWATVKASETAKGEAAKAKSSPKQIAKNRKGPTKSPSDESITLAVLRGRNFETTGEYDKARKLYEELYERHPENPQLAHRLGVVADAQRRHAEAEHYLLVALRDDPRNGEVLGDLGYCYFLQGQLVKAESALAKAVAVEPGDARHRNNLGLVLGHLGRHEEALAHFRKAGAEADACYNLAFIYASQERVAEARHCFQMALNADPTHRPSREALASFAEYESLPPHMRDSDTLADSGVRWVPFVEGDSGQVVQASNAAVTSRDASRVTRALHEDSRGMLNRNMHSQRHDEPHVD